MINVIVNFPNAMWLHKHLTKTVNVLTKEIAEDEDSGIAVMGKRADLANAQNVLRAVNQA